MLCVSASLFRIFSYHSTTFSECFRPRAVIQQFIQRRRIEGHHATAPNAEPLENHRLLPSHTPCPVLSKRSGAIPSTALAGHCSLPRLPMLRLSANPSPLSLVRPRRLLRLRALAVAASASASPSARSLRLLEWGKVCRAVASFAGTAHGREATEVR
jgi:hypothetical protein